MAQTEASPREPAGKDTTNAPWGAVGMVVLVLVAGAFVSGWRLRRRWGRFMGW